MKMLIRRTAVLSLRMIFLPRPRSVCRWRVFAPATDTHAIPRPKRLAVNPHPETNLNHAQVRSTFPDPATRSRGWTGRTDVVPEGETKNSGDRPLGITCLNW
jgi:hypothetical protein